MIYRDGAGLGPHVCTLSATSIRPLRTTGRHEHPDRQTPVLDRRGGHARERDRGGGAAVALAGMGTARAGRDAVGDRACGRATGVRNPQPAPVGVAGGARARDGPARPSAGSRIRPGGDRSELGRAPALTAAVAEQPGGVRGVPARRWVDRARGRGRRPQPEHAPPHAESRIRAARVRRVHDDQRTQLRGDRGRVAGQPRTALHPPDARAVPADAARPGRARRADGDPRGGVHEPRPAGAARPDHRAGAVPVPDRRAAAIGGPRRAAGRPLAAARDAAAGGAEHAHRDARAARPHDGAPRGRRSLATRGRWRRRPARARTNRSSRTPPGYCTTSASSCSRTGSCTRTSSRTRTGR